MSDATRNVLRMQNKIAKDSANFCGNCAVHNRLVKENSFECLEHGEVRSVLDLALL